MKLWAVVALCFCSSFVSASTIEEVVVTARQVKIVLERLQENHKQNPITGSWYFVETEKERDERKNEGEDRG